ncbi:MAG: sulfatase [Polyangiaceae bacterium]|nr:sulfatase [Polyangiaceae bacterium]
MTRRRFARASGTLRRAATPAACFAFAVAGKLACAGGAAPAPAPGGPAAPGAEEHHASTATTTTHSMMPEVDPSAAASPSAAAPTSAWTASSAAAPTPAPASAPLNVLMLFVDSMRADMPWAGYPREIAPHLTALEKQSVSWTRGYSVSSYTAKSVAAALSGRYPSSLKRSGYFFTKYPPSNVFFPELLQAAGVHTVSAHAHAYMSRGNGLDQGFVDWQVVGGISFDAQTDHHVTSDKLTKLVIEQLSRAPSGKPFFAYVHYMDPHDQYVQHEESPRWGTGLRDRYDSEIFYTDVWIGKLLEWCRAQPWWGTTAVIVSADHGEAFGEHKRFRHAFELYEVLVRVPLFLFAPGLAPRRVEVARSGVDLAPTILELMGQPPGEGLAGKSLVPEARGGVAEPRPVLLDLPADSNNPERRALIDGTWKLLVFGRDQAFQLFDLAADPGESKDLARKRPEELARMKKLYGEVWGAVPRVKPFGGNKLEGGGTASGPAN